MSTHPDAPVPAEIAGHETSDAEIGPLLRFAVFLAVVTAATSAATLGLYNYLDNREAVEKAPRHPMTVGVERPLPARPRVQTYPFDDIKGLRRDEARILEHYAWIDKTAGTVRIPVSRAMDILAQRGLPHRDSPAPAFAPGSPALTGTGTTRTDEPVIGSHE
jgi:hypothetical protein